MCMCGGGAHGPGTTCQWCGIGNGVPSNFALQLAIAQRDVARRDRAHSREMRRLWGDLWDDELGRMKPEYNPAIHQPRKDSNQP